MNKNKLVIVFFSFFLVVLPKGVQTELRIQAGPDNLPYVEKNMETAQYWIERLEKPDQLLFAKKPAQKQPAQWKHTRYFIDIFVLPDQLSCNTLREWLKSDFSYLQRVGRFNEQGQAMQQQAYQAIKKNVNLASLQGSNPVVWGMTVRRTQLRMFPTEEIITTKPLDTEFNMLLISGLRLAEPLAILYSSTDKKWFFVATTIARGWIKAQDAGVMVSKSALREQVRQSQTIVVGKEISFIQWKKKETEDRARMGCQLAFYKKKGNQLAFPRRDQQGKLYFIPVTVKERAALHFGPRPGTARVILEQAFILLGEAYSWGGGGGYGDCSEFIRRIGLTCGLELPRSTMGMQAVLPKEQLSGNSRQKAEQLSRLTGGRCLLYLPGHIMLVLGNVQGRTYVIHNLYGIHARDSEGDYIQRVARVLVSDLSLGEGSQKGSLRTRITAILFL